MTVANDERRWKEKESFVWARNLTAAAGRDPAYPQVRCMRLATWRASM